MTLVDESYLQPCDTCGAVVLPQQWIKHLTFHQELVELDGDVTSLRRELDQARQDLLTLALSTREIATNVGRLTQTVDRLTGISQMLFENIRQITGRIVAKSMGRT